MNRRLFLQVIWLPIASLCGKPIGNSGQGTIPESEPMQTTLAYIDSSGCIQPIPNGNTGDVVLLNSLGNPEWDTADAITVTPPPGFSSTMLKDLFAEMASAASGNMLPRVIISDGNSISDDPTPVYNFGNWRGWPYWVTSLSSTRVIAHAVGATDITECRLRAPVTVDKMQGLALETWVIIWEGTNYLGRSMSVSTTYAEHVAYCRERKAAGIDKVFIGTIISREPSVSYTIAMKNEFNDLLRNNWPSFADGLLDFASIPQLGGDTSYANTAYFFDGIHLTDAGNNLVANYVIQQLGL